jgi:hypothetical protein
VAAEGTMKQQETALVSSIKKTQTDYGNVWEDCMMIAMRLHNAFNDKDPELETDVIIDTVWEQAESRNEKELTETLAIQVEKLGVSEQKAQSILGYDTDDIVTFANIKLRNSAMTIRSQSVTQAKQADDNSDGLTQTESDDNDQTGTAAA